MIAVVDHLTLEIRGVDHVVVDEADGADPGRSEVERSRGAEAPGPDEHHRRIQELCLTRFADTR